MKEKKPHKKSWLYYYGIILLLLVVLNSFIFPALYNMSGKVQEVDYGTFLTMVDEGKVNQVDIENSKQITFTKLHHISSATYSIAHFLHHKVKYGYH